MANISAMMDGYVMVFMLYIFSNGLVFFTALDHMHVSWWGIFLLTIVETIAVYQVLHYTWIGNIFVLFLFFQLLKHFSGVSTYKLVYLNMIVVSYTTVCSLVFYLAWGASYTWHWREVGWMLLLYSCTSPIVLYCMRTFLWPRMLRLTLPASRWIWIVPAFAITIMMLVGSSHLQFLMAGYEIVYGLTALLVVILSAGVCLLILAILHKNQLVAQQKQDLALVNLHIAAESERHVTATEQMEDIRIMRHDLRHHVLITKMLLDKGDLLALRTYLGDMQSDHRLYDNIIYSQNLICDLVARHYVRVAQEVDARLTIRCGLPKAFWIGDSDLCILLSNLLENAVHACRLQTEGERKISMTLSVRNQEAYVLMENSCGDISQDSDEMRKGVGTLKSKGLGLLSIRHIAEKYGGAASFEQQNDSFHSSIILFRPRRDEACTPTSFKMRLKAK